MNIREFTKEDWYAFAGAEAFRDGEPLIFEKEFESGAYFCAVADAKCIEFHLFEEWDEKVWYMNVMNSKRVQTCLFTALLEEMGIDECCCAADVENALDGLIGVNRA